MCSQEGGKLLVKAWVELMQYLADVWVEARTPLRGWKPAVTEPGFQWSTDRLAAVPVVNTRVLKRVEDLEREIPPIGCCGHWFYPSIWLRPSWGWTLWKGKGRWVLLCFFTGRATWWSRNSEKQGAHGLGLANFALEKSEKHFNSKNPPQIHSADFGAQQ